jgi:hypothetical protein
MIPHKYFIPFTKKILKGFIPSKCIVKRKEKSIMEKERNLNSIEKRLATWQVEVPTQPGLKQSIVNRIRVQEAEENSSLPGWLAFMHPIIANRATTVALVFSIFIVAGISMIAFHERKMRLDAESCRSYFLIIDPVAHIAALNNTKSSNDADRSVADMLDWMKSRLGLSREQFAQMVELHKNYSVKFASLYSELSEIESEYQIFEKNRRNDEAIDFMALYDLLQKRDVVRANSEATSKELVDLIFQILTPDQKNKFLSLLSYGNASGKRTSEDLKAHAGV